MGGTTPYVYSVVSGGAGGNAGVVIEARSSFSIPWDIAHKMDKDVALALITAAAPCMCAGIGFFVRAYFKQLEKMVHESAKDSAQTLGELKGQLTMMQTDLRSNTIEITKASTELRAVWRFIDATPRASDIANGPA
jgi:hypothetical protein